MDNLDDLLDAVSDRQSFLTFVKALVADREAEVATERANPSAPYGPGARGWESGSIEAYLESAVAWTEAWIGREGELPEAPSWKSFARFLYAGKYYE